MSDKLRRLDAPRLSPVATTEAEEQIEKLDNILTLKELCERADASVDASTIDPLDIFLIEGVPSKYLIRYKFLTLTGDPSEDRLVHLLRAAVLSHIVGELSFPAPSIRNLLQEELAASKITPQEITILDKATVRQDYHSDTGGYKITVTAPTEEVVQSAIDRIKASYPPFGYGTKFSKPEQKEGFFAALGWRSKSC